MRDKITIHNVFEDPNEVDSAGIAHTSLTFPGGEPHVHLPAEHIKDKYVWVDARLCSAEGWMRLMATLWAIKVIGPKWLGLHIPYFPGARQDRQEEGGAFSVEMYCNMLGNAVLRDITWTSELSAIVVADPHSGVVGQYLSQIAPTYPIFPTDIFPSNQRQYAGVIRPDKGAESRSYDMAKHLKVPLYRAQKHRDSLTGRLSGFSCEALSNPTGRYLISDDICDGGGTFLGLADVIKAASPEVELDLYVTHGIFSKGYDELLKRFDKIYTTDGFPTEGPQRVDVFTLRELAASRMRTAVSKG